MRLPDDFSYSQQNLQDYSDCRFRFLLKYIKKLDWPAVESEPVVLQEARMELGQQFHRLVQQYFIGVDIETLSSSIHSPELAAWWEVFLALKLNETDGEKHAEKMLSVPINGQRLLAKYDLLIVNTPGRFTIYDWKTSVYQQSRQNLFTRLQSRVYPYVLRQSIENSPAGESGSPDIEMIYWFPSFPDTPYQFYYSPDRFEEDREFLHGLTDEILSLPEEGYSRTVNEKLCTYCRYRSLCDRGVAAGVLTQGVEEEDVDTEFNFDFDLL